MRNFEPCQASLLVQVDHACDTLHPKQKPCPILPPERRIRRTPASISPRRRKVATSGDPAPPDPCAFDLIRQIVIQRPQFLDTSSAWRFC